VSGAPLRLPVGRGGGGWVLGEMTFCSNVELPVAGGGSDVSLACSLNPSPLLALCHIWAAFAILICQGTVVVTVPPTPRSPVHSQPRPCAPLLHDCRHHRCCPLLCHVLAHPLCLGDGLCWTPSYSRYGVLFLMQSLSLSVAGAPCALLLAPRFATVASVQIKDKAHKCTHVHTHVHRRAHKCTHKCTHMHKSERS